MLHSHLFDSSISYTWIFTPSIVIGLISLITLYAFLVYTDRRDGFWDKDLRGRHIAFFAAGILAMYIALQSPLDEISDKALLSAHMVQHILLALIAPPLLLLGVPTRWLRSVSHLPIIGPLFSFLTNPLIALLVFNLDFWLWHLPALYEGALHDENIHIVEHLLFIATGAMLWIPILHSVSATRPIGYLTKIALLFFSMISSGILGAIFTFAPNLIYTFYGNAPSAFGLSPLDDQQLAGAIMWVPGGGIFFASLLITFAAWLNSEDRKGQMISVGAMHSPPDRDRQ